MADTAANSGTIRNFSVGGTVRIVRGATTYGVLNIVAGSVSVVPAYRAREIDLNNGDFPAAPRENQPVPGRITLEAKISSVEGTASLPALLQAAGANGLADTFTCSVFLPDPGSRTVGDLFEAEKCFWETPPQIDMREDATYLRVELQFLDLTAAWAAFTLPE